VFQKRGDRWYVVQEHLSDLPPVADSLMAAMPDMPGMPAGGTPKTTAPAKAKAKAKAKAPK